MPRRDTFQQGPKPTAKKIQEQQPPKVPPAPQPPQPPSKDKPSKKGS